MLVKMPLDGCGKAGEGNSLSFDLTQIHNILKENWPSQLNSWVDFAIIGVKCICIEIKVFNLVHRWHLNNGVWD